MEQAFNDLRTRHGGTTQASQAALLVARVLQASGKEDQAKEALDWITSHASDEGYRAIGRLRLTSILIAQGAYDQALAQLSADFPPEFAGSVADRRGDVQSLLGKRNEAIAQYQLAYRSFGPSVEYRSLVEVKLNAMGVRPEEAASGPVKDSVK